MSGDSRRSAPKQRVNARPAAPVVRPVLGAQTMVRVTGPLVRVSGRPDASEMAEIAATIGARLRELRAQHGLSLRDLERRTGLDRSSISLLERGQRRVRGSMLGWIAWAIDPDSAEPLKRELMDAAGASLITESRWSERAHARRACRALWAGDLPLGSGWLIAPWMAGIFGAVMPDRLADLHSVQQAGRRGDIPWPACMAGSSEALHLLDEIGEASPSELAALGRAILAAGKAEAMRRKRRAWREERARRGLTGTTTPRPRWCKPGSRGRRKAGAAR